MEKLLTLEEYSAKREILKEKIRHYLGTLDDFKELINSYIVDESKGKYEYFKN